MDNLSKQLTPKNTLLNTCLTTYLYTLFTSPKGGVTLDLVYSSIVQESSETSSEFTYPPFNVQRVFRHSWVYLENTVKWDSYWGWVVIYELNHPSGGCAETVLPPCTQDSESVEIDLSPYTHPQKRYISQKQAVKWDIEKLEPVHKDAELLGVISGGVGMLETSSTARHYHKEFFG